MQDVVDECLVTDRSLIGFSPDRLEDVGIDPDRDELPSCRTDRRSSHRTHGGKLLSGERPDIAVRHTAIPHTLSFPGGSRIAR